MWPLSPRWHDPLTPGAPGDVFLASSGLRVRALGAGSRAIVFLHGLGASLRYWGRAYDGLASRHRLVFLDLLGFGGSEKLEAETYSVREHAERVAATLASLSVEETVIVGHSAGGLVALALGAEAQPESRVVAFGAPVFPDEQTARRHLRNLGFMERLMADRSPWATRMCEFLCSHRELGRALAPLFAPTLPSTIAADGVDHIWASYRGTFESIVGERRVSSWIERLGDRAVLVYGREDMTTPKRMALAALGPGAPIQRVMGDHHLPVRHPRLCLQVISRST